MGGREDRGVKLLKMTIHVPGTYQLLRQPDTDLL